MDGYCDSLRRCIESLRLELERKDALLWKVVEELHGSPHTFVKEIRNEIIDELSAPKQRGVGRSGEIS